MVGQQPERGGGHLGAERERQPGRPQRVPPEKGEEPRGARADEPTIVTVAQAAGVSRQTVSNVLNAPDKVRPETRRRVQEAVERLGYQPSLVARQLRSRRARTLGVRLEPQRDGLNGWVLDRFLHAVVEVARLEGYRVLVYAAVDEAEEVRAHEELLGGGQVEGFVLHGTHVDDRRVAWLSERGVPFTLFGRPAADARTSFSWVDVDGAAGTRAATEHLWSLGHRRIGYLGWSDPSGVGDERHRGYRYALANLGVGVEDLRGLDVAVGEGVHSGADGARRLLEQEDPPTALVCASDSLALGALPLARGAHAAVVGFDDSPVAAAVGLSSVRQPLGPAAAACVQRLVATAQGDATPPSGALLPPDLVVRASSHARRT